MKTQLPKEIKTVDEAKKLLADLHKNGEAFHPEDDAHSIVGDPYTKEEGDLLNKLMADIYNLPGNDGRHAGPMIFDPCEYLNELSGHTVEPRKIKTISYKLWITVEKHVEYEDGSDHYEDLPDTTASCGEFDDEQEAIDRMEHISAKYS